MRYPSFFSVTAVVAAVTLLASCSNSTAPTSATAATDPSFEVGPRIFTLTPGSPGWMKMPEDPIPTDTRTVLIGGLLAVATYPSFGTPVYTGTSEAGNWLEINLQPTFSLNPLGWKVTFKLKPLAQTLPIGSYTATIPVSIPAALNNPQNIVVTFNNCGNCLFLGDYRLTQLTAGATFDWHSLDYYDEGNRSYFFEYRVFVRPGETVYMQNRSSAYGNGATLGDPTLTLYEGNAPIFTGITYNDDCSGLSSEIGPITNNGLTTHEYRLRAGAYSGRPTGFSNVYISPTSYCGNGGGGDDEGNTLRAQPDSIQAIIAAKKAVGGH